MDIPERSSITDYETIIPSVVNNDSDENNTRGYEADCDSDTDRVDDKADYHTDSASEFNSDYHNMDNTKDFDDYILLSDLKTLSYETLISHGVIPLPVRLTDSQLIQTFLEVRLLIGRRKIDLMQDIVNFDSDVEFVNNTLHSGTDKSD